MVRNFLEALRGTNPGGSEWPAQHGFQVFVMKTAVCGNFLPEYEKVQNLRT